MAQDSKQVWESRPRLKRNMPRLRKSRSRSKKSDPRSKKGIQGRKKEVRLKKNDPRSKKNLPNHIYIYKIYIYIYKGRGFHSYVKEPQVIPYSQFFGVETRHCDGWIVRFAGFIPLGEAVVLLLQGSKVQLELEVKLASGLFQAIMATMGSSGHFTCSFPQFFFLVFGGLGAAVSSRSVALCPGGPPKG